MDPEHAPIQEMLVKNNIDAYLQMLHAYNLPQNVAQFPLYAILQSRMLRHMHGGLRFSSKGLESSYTVSWDSKHNQYKSSELTPGTKTAVSTTASKKLLYFVQLLLNQRDLLNIHHHPSDADVRARVPSTDDILSAREMGKTTCADVIIFPGNKHTSGSICLLAQTQQTMNTDPLPSLAREIENMLEQEKYEEHREKGVEGLVDVARIIELAGLGFYMWTPASGVITQGTLPQQFQLIRMSRQTHVISQSKQGVS